MPTRNKKGRFVKGGHKSKALVRTRTVTKVKYRNRTAHPAHKRSTRRRGKHGSGMPKLLPVIGTAAALGFLTGKSGPDMVKEQLAKVPGAKTFGTVAVAGAACLAIDRFVKPNRYLKIAGLIGVGYAALVAAQKGTDFQWTGDVEDTGDIDLEGDDDMGDPDDDMGDIDESGDIDDE
jgi:hypothetical protein